MGPLEVGERPGGQSEPSGGRRGAERREWALWMSERGREAKLVPLEVGEG